MSLPLLLDRAAGPLDAVRRAALGLALRDRRVARVVVERDARVGTTLLLHGALALVLAVLAPSLLVVLGPVLLGVVHVAADVRYLVLRRSLPRWWQAVIVGFCISLVGVRVLAESRVFTRGIDASEAVLVITWVAVGLAAGCAVGRSAFRAAVGVSVLAGVAFGAVHDPRGARLVFAHAHNLVALVLWVTVFRRRAAAVALPVAVVVGAAMFLASGAFYGVTMAHGQVSAFGIHVFQAADWLAPDLPADRAVGLTCAYVFLQSVHYLVWLGLVPQDDAAGRGLSSFRSSFGALRRDFGRAGVALVAVASLVVLAGAFFDAPRARGLYLSLSLFHGYLELALLAYFWGRGRLPFTERA